MATRKPPIWTLIDTVRAALVTYDRTSDHSSHGANADCIRCRIQAALHFDGQVQEFRSTGFPTPTKKAG